MPDPEAEKILFLAGGGEPDRTDYRKVGPLLRILIPAIGAAIFGIWMLLSF